MYVILVVSIDLYTHIHYLYLQRLNELYNVYIFLPLLFSFLFFIFIIFISSLYYSNLYKISFVFKVYVQHERNPTHMYKYIFPLSIIRSRLHSHIFYHTTHDYLPTRIFSFFFLFLLLPLFSPLFFLFFFQIYSHTVAQESSGSM